MTGTHGRTCARATYRVQLSGGTGFDEAAALVPYLRDLGVSHLYASPSLQAAPGSTHGYDVVDPGALSEELGGAAAHERLHRALADAGLAMLLDIVPNHMSIASPRNRWWWDVLENGAASRYAAHFDVDWASTDPHVGNRILLPVLSDHYGRRLAAGALVLRRDGERFTVQADEGSFPLEPASLQGLLARAAVRCGSDELAFLAEALGAAAQEAGVAGDASAASAANAANAASAASTVTEDPRRRAAGLRRARTVRVVRARLAALLAPGAAEAAAADAEVSALNADPAALHALLELQHYRLASWRMAGSRALGFRRFFDINTLVGLRVEDAAVFDDAHRLVLDLLAAGTIDGVRVDHVDGLRDPRGYLERLRAAAPRAWILVEKILAPDEALRPEWPVDGSTGYDFLALVGGLFVDPAGAEPLRRLHAEFTGNGASWDEQRTASRRLALESLLRADVLRLVELLADACERDLLHRDHPRRLLQEALVEVLSRFPVYRTYVSAGRGEVSEADRALLRDVVARSAQARADLPPDLFDFLLDILTLSRDDALHADIALHVQQLAAPAAAKGVEDTAFYRHAPLLALNEVGGDPDRFGVEPGEFLRRCAESQQRWPATLLATSTHDTKFSEDVRARLAVLSELPEAWRDAVQRWSGLAQRHRTGVLPDRAMEWRLWQSWVGAHPIDVERMQAAMLKAAREAKLHTSWTAAQPGYEAALQRFVQGVMEDEEIAGDVAAFTATILDAGRRNALSQTLLKLTAPGVPDIYQGCELWSLRLVDPDNRAPVEWAGLRRALDELRDATPERILERMDGGLPKLHVIRATLALRAAHPEAFGPESPVGALPVAGARAAHVVAMARGDRLAVLAPRLVVRLGGDWRDTTVVLGAGTWRNVFTAERVSGGSARLDDLLARFPVALLWREDAA